MPPAKRLLPQPETGEPRLHNPGLFDFSPRDHVAIVKRAGRSALADQITDSAAALAYYTFLAIPATLLVALGAFGLIASPQDVVEPDGPAAGHRARRGRSRCSASHSRASRRAAAEASRRS